VDKARKKGNMKMKRTLKTLLVVTLALLMLACAACSAQPQTTPAAQTSATPASQDEATPSASTELEKVTVILDYLPNTNHTGMYVALEKGYYKDVGLDVEIIQPSEGATATLIATGKGDFGVSYQEDVTYALTAEQPLPIKAIATLVQHNTSGFAWYAEKPIESPKDFEGKVYSGWGSPGEEAVLAAVMKAAGADPTKLTIVSSGESGFAKLKENVDLIWIFEGWDGKAAEYQGFPLKYVPLRDLDERLDYYTPVLITSDKLINENPEMVKKFLEATRKGYLDCIADPDGAAEILAKQIPEYDVEYLKLSQQYLSEEYMKDNPRWGEMKAEVWDGYTEFMLENGLIPSALKSEDAFTNEFLPE
jgi:ABC-type nitrate/sulfonate/bicarbonate transport system substrate-binding protein